MISPDSLLVTYSSISMASIGIAAVIAGRDVGLHMAVDELLAGDMPISRRAAKLVDLQRLTEIADIAHASRKAQRERVKPEDFGRNDAEKRKKKPIFTHH